LSPGPIRTATAAATDVGRRRSDNEDRYAVWTSDDDRAGSPEALLVVCDGMGGSNAGEVASRLAVDTVLRVYEEKHGEDPLEALTAAVQAANQEVWQHSRTRADLQGMGTTCTAVAVRGTEALLVHVGDSRAYLIRDGRARQLTSDHSLVAQLVASGQLTKESARTDPRRNVVTRSVGATPSVEVEAIRLEDPLRPGDTLLLCSDGLHGQVSEDEIGRLASHESLDRVCRDLIALANQRGGPDNITVAVARPGVRETARPRPAPRAPAAATKAPRATKRTLQLLIAALVALMLVLCGLAWVVFGMMRAERQPATSANVEAGGASGGTGGWR
jgi:protein phosphatase